MIVYLAARPFLPPEDGWARRSAHVLRALAAVAPVRIVQVTGAPGLVRDSRFVPDGRVTVDVPGGRLAGRATTVARSLAGDVPFQVARLASDDVVRAIRDACLAPTTRLVVANTIVTAALVPDDLRVPLVIDTHNVDSLVARRYAAVLPSRLERVAATMNVWQYERLERRFARRAAEWWMCSEDDRQALDRVAGHVRATVLPNGVDTDEFTPGASRSGAPDLVFFGRLDYRPNTDAVRWLLADIWPRIVAARPDARLSIIGAGDMSAFADLVAATPGATLTGLVPDLAERLRRATLAVVPLRVGGGTRLKILEAFAAGLPVVTTTIGVEGIPVVSGDEALVADEPQSIADAVVTLLADPSRAATIGAAARRLVERRYAWRAIEARIAESVTHLLPDVT
ncbi:MAG: glycosyltransferase family 4 protein [Gemmatimonadaceae bacterium]|nr:glycosyltransferase family 4 protein [Gemmatimonadaceae bacterium]